MSGDGAPMGRPLRPGDPAELGHANGSAAPYQAIFHRVRVFQPPSA